jgi:hypothetical protein
MRRRVCPMCEADMSTVPVKKRQFRKIVVTIVRCPDCKFRTTFLSIRKSGNVDAHTQSRFAGVNRLRAYER